MESIFKLGILLRVMDFVSGPVTAMGKVIDSLEAKVKKLAPVFDKFKDYGQWIAGAGVVGALGLGIAVTQFANLEEAQLGLKTLLMDASGRIGPEYEKLNKLAAELGTSLPGSTMDMIRMFIALREQGVQTNVILGGVGKAAANFSVLMKIPFDQGATMVAKFTEALGIADSESVQFMDTLQRLKGAAGVNTTDLYESLKYVGSTLKMLRVQGLDAGRDVSAALGMMATSTIEGSQAGTNFAMALSRFAEINSKLGRGLIAKEIAPLLDAKGIKLNLFDDGGNFVGIRAMIGELEKLRVLKDDDKLLVLSKLFGEEAKRPLSVFIDKGVAGFDAMLLRMQKQADMQKKIDTIMSGTKAQWETLTGTISTLVASIGAVVARVAGLTGIMSLLNNVAGKLNDWILANPTTAGIIAGIAIAITGLALTVGGLLFAIGLGGSLFLKMSMGAGLLVQGLVFMKAALIGLIPAVWSFTTALLANPVTWIVIGIAALIAGLAWLYNRFEAVRTAVQFFNFFLGFLIGNLLKLVTIKGWLNLFGSGRAIVTTLVSGIKSMAMAPVDAVKGIFSRIRNLLPFSDAKEGPLSQLTLSGQRIMDTMGDGIRRSAPNLQRTMAGALAGVALTANVSATNQARQGNGPQKTLVIQQLTVQLHDVSDAKSFIRELQALVEGYDAA